MTRLERWLDEQERMLPPDVPADRRQAYVDGLRHTLTGEYLNLADKAAEAVSDVRDSFKRGWNR